ncbi:MAG: hypothetical protein KF883_01610 [Thermomicrobiales bacterium]|nr:hypothetical protein [Thermomicrobiales bacterium]
MPEAPLQLAQDMSVASPFMALSRGAHPGFGRRACCPLAVSVAASFDYDDVNYQMFSTE